VSSSLNDDGLVTAFDTSDVDVWSREAVLFLRDDAVDGAC
jgi:hypothetical protein